MNLQAGGDITLGANYLEVRQIAMDVYRANMIELRELAAEIASERAESFLDSFLNRAAQEGHPEIPQGSNPDFQYALFSAQKEYACTGDHALGDLLVQLLVDRIEVHDRDLMQIVLNESLAIAPRGISLLTALLQCGQEPSDRRNGRFSALSGAEGGTHRPYDGCINVGMPRQHCGLRSAPMAPTATSSTGIAPTDKQIAFSRIEANPYSPSVFYSLEPSVASRTVMGKGSIRALLSLFVQSHLQIKP